MSRGYITTGFGYEFANDAHQLCISIKRYETTHFTLFSNTKYNEFPCFDATHIYKVNDKIRHPHEKYNVDVMLNIYRVLPYDETIFMDSDVIRMRKTQLFDFMSSWAATNNQSFVAFGKNKDCSWHFGTVCDIEKKHNIRLPHTHAGIIYMKKGAMLDLFFAYANEAAQKYNSLDFKRRLKGRSKALEIHLSYAMGRLKWHPIDFKLQDEICFYPVNESRVLMKNHVHVFNSTTHDMLIRHPQSLKYCKLP